MKTRNCKKLFMALAAFVLCLLTGLFVSPTKAEAATKAKIVLEFTDGTKETWKTGDNPISLGKKKLAYVYFGEYPQTEVTGKKLTKAIKNAKYDKNGIATVKGVKYKRISKSDATYDNTSNGLSGYYDWSGKSYAYFKFEPIKWRVLSNKKGTVLLMSEYGLDDRKYNFEYVDITWADCTLRSWLNSDFLTSAFNAKERKLIKTAKVKNNDNSYYGTEGGKDTKDKVFLLSLEEIVNTKYGFASDRYEDDISRRCSATDYAKAMGAYTAYSEGYYVDDYKTKEGKWASWWWLRSPGCSPGRAASVYIGGYVYDDGFRVDLDDSAVRPALRLNLSSVIN